MFHNMTGLLANDPQRFDLSPGTELKLPHGKSFIICSFLKIIGA